MIEINDLETQRFGIKCARLDGEAAELPDLEQVLRQAVANQVKMLSTRVDVSHLNRVHQLEAVGFQLMDTLVYYGRSPHPLPVVNAPQKTEIRMAQPIDAPAVSRVAAAAFQNYLGHYHTDPLLDRQKADEVYIDWASRSTTAVTPENPVLVAIHAGDIVGFAACRRNSNSEFELVLNAVHPNQQRFGIYSNLVVRALGLAANLGTKQFITSTQINNYSVQRVWSRLGFSPIKSKYTLHKWFS